MQTHTHTHTYAPEVVYGICCPGFPHCNCQTVNHAEQICINLVKLIHNLIIRSSLIIEKKTFKVFIGQWSIKSISNSNLGKVSEQVRGNIETHDTGLVRQITCSSQ